MEQVSVSFPRHPAFLSPSLSSSVEKQASRLSTPPLSCFLSCPPLLRPEKGSSGLRPPPRPDRLGVGPPWARCLEKSSSRAGTPGSRCRVVKGGGFPCRVCMRSPLSAPGHPATSRRLLCGFPSAPGPPLLKLRPQDVVTRTGHGLESLGSPTAGRPLFLRLSACSQTRSRLRVGLTLAQGSRQGGARPGCPDSGPSAISTVLVGSGAHL